MARCHALRDDQWKPHQDLLPRARRNRRRDRQGQSSFCRGVPYRYRAGIPLARICRSASAISASCMCASAAGPEPAFGARVLAHLVQDADNQYAMTIGVLTREQSPPVPFPGFTMSSARLEAPRGASRSKTLPSVRAERSIALLSWIEPTRRKRPIAPVS